MRRFFFANCLAACLALAACSGGSDAPSTTEIPDGIEHEGPPLPLAERGLDTRPANPSCIAPPRPRAFADVALSRVYPDFNAATAIGMQQAPNDASRWFFIEKRGVVRVFSAGGSGADASVFIDISARVASDPSEAGLLGMAFHPSFQDNGWVYLSYTGPATTPGQALTSYVSRFTANAERSALDPASERVLMRLDQPYENHNGGHIAFGPDGFLYVGFGDGGSSGDPHGNAQNPHVLLGKILRIDVNAGEPYGIPAGNPFSGGGGRGEVFALGLRNPWRWSFDRATGALWAGDVGQNAREEIDLIEAGGNYGWPIREGASCYEAASCASTGFIDPVVDYGHDLGYSITGGYVYRGSAIPALQGAYVFGDFGSGTIWALPAQGAPIMTTLFENGSDGVSVNIASFAEGHDGELYVLNYAPAAIYKIVPRPGAVAPTPFPARLSATGCVDTNNPSQPAAGLVPYGVNVPFWSDGAVKQRWLAVPDGSAIRVDADGTWQFPIGTVLMKHFRMRDRLIETRLYMRHPDGEWGGYSYEWDDAQTDAVLLAGSKVKTVDGRPWRYPSGAQCRQCHTPAAGNALGAETAQMNRLFNYTQTGRRANQIATLAHIGLLQNAPSPSTASALANIHDANFPAPVRARSYLQANCAQCHRPGANTQANMDLRFGTAETAMNVCNVVPTQGDMGMADARLVVPGDPARSLLSLRMRATDRYRMPPLGSHFMDAAGVAVVEAWIAAKSGCN